MGDWQKRIVKMSIPISLAIGAVAIATYIGGLTAMVTVTGEAGSAPESQTFNFSESLTNAVPTAEEYIDFENPDGPGNLSFSLVDNIASTDAICNYIPGSDLKVEIKRNGDSYQTINATGSLVLAVEPGTNSYMVKLTKHENSCPLSGSLTLSAVQS